MILRSSRAAAGAGRPRPGLRTGSVPDSSEPDASRAIEALAQRLTAVAAVLLPDRDPGGAGPSSGIASGRADPAHRAGELLELLVHEVAADPKDDRVWLLIAGVTGSLPTRDELDDIRRLLDLADPRQATADLLAACLPLVRLAGSPDAEMDIVAGGVVIDVDFTARHDLHTGIQRVVRQTLPLWQREHRLVAIAWTSRRGAPRRLRPAEESRAFQWSATRSTASGGDREDDEPTATDRIVVPWRSVMVVPEVPTQDLAPRLAALAAVSGNRMVAVGHDAIPLLSADALDPAEPDKYMAYLSALKYAKRVAGVSRSATAEFAAFASMLAAQGLTGPTAVAVPLPVDFASRDVLVAHPDGGALPHIGEVVPYPEVVVVGGHDPRKNHEAVLGAAELVWRKGIRFRLSFIGAGGSNDVFLQRLAQLRDRGRDIRLQTGLSDAELRVAMATASFTVFPSLHEGYGLPAAESLALGTPVITTEYGSTAEIAADGGALVVDPRDDQDLATAMESLLTDQGGVLSRLRADIARRPVRTWGDYAGELWNALVDPELAALADDN